MKDIQYKQFSKKDCCGWLLYTAKHVAAKMLTY